MKTPPEPSVRLRAFQSALLVALAWVSMLLVGCTPTDSDGSRPSPASSPASARPSSTGDWSMVSLGQTDITGLSFIDGRTGWASSPGVPAFSTGAGGVWRTTDAGASWALVAADTFADLGFVDEATGWALGLSGGMFASTDGGLTWKRQALPNEPENLYQVRFTDARHGAIASGQYGAHHGGWVFVTTDGGRTWRAHAVTDTPVRAVFFVDPREGWAAGDQDIAHTMDGGRTWTVLMHRDNGALAAKDLWFADRRHGWLASEIDGSIRATSDGGRTWRISWRDTKSGVYAVRFADAATGWAVGIRYPDFDNAAAAGEVPGQAQGLILSTVDGGATWTEELIAPTRGLFDLALLGDETVVAVGEAGVLRRSTER